MGPFPRTRGILVHRPQETKRAFPLATPRGHRHDRPAGVVEGGGFFIKSEEWSGVRFRGHSFLSVRLTMYMERQGARVSVSECE